MTLAQCAKRLKEGVDWLPLHDSLVFVELKLSRVAAVFHQAYNHTIVGESYAALPLSVAERVVGQERWTRYGVGLLGVAEDGVTVFHPAMKANVLDEYGWQQVAIVERFWKDRRKQRTLAAKAAERTE